MMKFTLCCVLSLLFGICFANHNEPDTVCSLPADSGMCYAYFPMFFYDAPSGKCINFIYGGCGGNENRFWTEDECTKRCGGSGGTGKEPVEEEKGPIFLGPTKGGQGVILQKPVDGEKEVIFQHPVDEGRGVILQQIMNVAKGTPFQQTVEGGKGVIFPQPTATGKGTILLQPADGGKGAILLHPIPSDACNQEKQSGDCSSQLVRYYFDKDSRKCERFLYSGCGKNANNFNYKFECERVCPGEKDLGDACNFEKETGPCRAFFPRFYFSRESGQCEGFIYGGCGGNHNNFKTKEECLRFCTSGKGSPLP